MYPCTKTILRENLQTSSSIFFLTTDAGTDETPDLELPDPRSIPVELPLVVEEARVGCMTAMLMCLDRRQRMVFILGEYFGVTSEVGGDVMEVSPEYFRQLLSRARRDLPIYERQVRTREDRKPLPMRQENSQGCFSCSPITSASATRLATGQKLGSSPKPI